MQGRHGHWHEGTTQADEIWLKLGGDKNGGYFKMNLQIANTQAENSICNTCVFSCFEASDTLSNLHVALDRSGQNLYDKVEVRKNIFVSIIHIIFCVQGTTSSECFSVATMSTFLGCMDILVQVVRM